MKKTIYLWLTATIVFAFMFQSCVKNQPILGNQFREDKLLLSKVTGTNIPIAWDPWEFKLDVNKHAWDYFASYSYGSGPKGWDDCKPLQKVSFAHCCSYFAANTDSGSWDITYKNFLPDEIIDYSNPNLDQGYWKLYYNDKLQVVKTGFAFSTPAGPTEFEFYGYDDHNNLTDLVYGKYVDTPLFKLTFAYDDQGNLTQWQFLSPNGYTNATASASLKSLSLLSGLPKGKGLISSPIIGALNRISANFSNRKQNLSTSDLSFKIPPTKLVGDSNVVYQNYLTATITNDGKINPFHQQGRLLFFISSRYYSADVDVNFWELQKSNPVNIQYTLNPDFGSFAPMVSNFSYTYNKQGYPVTTHEATADPDEIWTGLTYTQDRQIEYIKND